MNELVRLNIVILYRKIQLFMLLFKTHTPIKGKVLALLLIILLALALLGGHLFLTNKITVGERQIADGQRQLKKGQLMFKEGKAKLKSGKKELSQGVKEYEKSKSNIFLVLADKVLKNGNGFKQARKEITEGERQIAKGERMIYFAEMQLAEGKLELRRGKEHLRLAKGVCFACAIGAAFFAFLSLLLGFSWRRSLAQIFLHSDA
jgi:hypothetical protein